MKQVIVRAFGARLPKAQEPIATSVFQQQNRLWNALVEIERDSRTKYRNAVEQSDPELAQLVAQADAEQVVVDALIEGRNKDRQTQRRKKTANAESFSALIKASSAKIKDYRIAMRACKERAKAAAKPLTEAIELDRRAKVKTAVSEANLWWAHAETVITKYDTSRVKAMKEGAELRFHRFEGEGSMGIRLPSSGAYVMADIAQGRTSMITMRDATPEELGRMSAQKADGGRRVVVALRAGDKSESGPAKLEFLTTLHAGRDFPLDVPLKTVTARRDMHVNKPEWKLVFTFSNEVDKLPAASELPKQAVGIDFGWRMVKDAGLDALRVATICYGERYEFVTLDGQWLARMHRADRLRGELDDIANIFAAKLLQSLAGYDLTALDEDNWFRVIAGKAQRAKGAYAGLLMSVCDAHEKCEMPMGEGANVWMQEWRKEAFKKSVEAHHCRRKAVDHRKHMYRNVASKLVKQAGLFGIEDIKLAGMALRVAADGEDSELSKTSRRNRTWASVYELKLAIEQCARREQREIVKVPAADTTRTCSACGHVHGHSIKDLVFVCDGCGKVLDQDENASNNCRNFALSFETSAVESTT
jgi:Putative transposase DNA-binding domain